MAVSNDIKNWKDYLERKFSDEALYQIIDNTDVLSNGVYRVESKTNETVIDFICPNQDWSTLDDIQFYSGAAKAWSGELLGGNNPKAGLFNRENLDSVERLLKTPIKYGWISVEYYLGKRLFKAVAYKNENGSMGEKIFTDYNTGLAGVMLLPFTLLINIFLHLGWIGKKSMIVVDPIVKTRR
ncbi:hypothetical protein [Pontibacter chinhatensis]|uniref:Uncharacterized protein n=1 Tax=Pontibacter chinhatensis TaxID=1436961 RepID=A0A1I2YH39_9BACT|nr:hypothetical protein [Pontibacter chinhatensis]SFH24900.1 hypothetical protein SAMN05421739_10872 [Pontibacter chinhatensis]